MRTALYACLRRLPHWAGCLEGCSVCPICAEARVPPHRPPLWTECWRGLAPGVAIVPSGGSVLLVALGAGFWGAAPQKGQHEQVLKREKVGPCWFLLCLGAARWSPPSLSTRPGWLPLRGSILELGPGAGDPRQPSWGGACCAVLGRLGRAALSGWGRGSPSSPQPSVFPVVGVMLSVPSSACISFSSGLCMMHTHFGEETVQALVRFSPICVMYFRLVPRANLVMCLGAARTLLTEPEAWGQSLLSPPLLLFSRGIVSYSWQPRSCSTAHQAPHPWDSPGKNTGGGGHFLFQGIFPTQGANLGLLRWQADYNECVTTKESQ